MTIIETAFFKFITALTLEDRTDYLWECGRASGELYFELAEHFNEYHPVKLALKVEEYLNVRNK